MSTLQPEQSSTPPPLRTVLEQHILCGTPDPYGRLASTDELAAFTSAQLAAQRVGEEGASTHEQRQRSEAVLLFAASNY